jgi:hypothetical protein
MNALEARHAAAARSRSRAVSLTSSELGRAPAVQRPVARSRN